MAQTREILKFAVETGDQLLRNGAEIYRVEDTVMYILHQNGIEQCDVYVLSNGIFASANEDLPDACSVIRHVPLGSVHLGRIAALNQLTRDVCEKRCSIEDGWKRLELCRELPLYKDWIQLAMCGVGSAGFCYLFGGNVFDAMIAFVIGMLEQFVLAGCVKFHISRFVKNIIASGFVSLVCAGLGLAGMGMDWDKVIIGAIMPLVPGIAFTTAIRDFYNGDYLSGTIHLFDAVLTAVCIAVGSCLPLILRNILVRM